MSDIIVRGAREHNLRNVNLEVPRNQLTVFTGVSGSGKSSLAFDTLYAEGRRRYVESLSNYARQFLGQLPKPDVDHIDGLSPAVSIQQKSAGRNPRSTVGTITEISDFLRVLYARLGIGHCPKCDRPIAAQSREQILARIAALPEGTKFLILAPVVRGQKGEFKDFFADMGKRGYVRARVDGKIVVMNDDLKLDKKIKHTIEIVVDRLKNDPKIRPRLAEAVDQALTLSDGALVVSVEQEDGAFDDLLLSAKYACTTCGISYEPPSPQLFSFNSPQGMCHSCDGLGTRYSFDSDLLIPNPALSIYAGAIPLVGPLKGMGRWRKHIYEGICKYLEIDVQAPWKSLPEAGKERFLQGTGDERIVWEWKQRGGSIWRHAGKWEGVIPQLLSQFRKATAGPRRAQLEKYMSVKKCSDCGGQRLNSQARAVRVGGLSLIELGKMAIGDLVPWFTKYEQALKPVEQFIAGELLKEIRGRLGFLLNVGLHYLSLDRAAPTLSGGEAQRIRLASQIGSGLVGVLYILDEPSIGLHPRDNGRLLKSILDLRDMGNTVIVVEHDEETMLAADHLVDFGPGPGVRGGEIVSAGTPAEVVQDPKSLTGKYLSGTAKIVIPEQRRKGNGSQLRIVNARHNNLKNVTVDIPLGLFVCVTGVSGSGKSSLVNDVLKEALLAAGRGDSPVAEETEEEETHVVGSHDAILGTDAIDKVIDIDQSPIGRTPRSNPATYIKVFDEIRNHFAQMTEAKTRGYKAGRFSFNRPEGRCEACEGNGSNRLEMDFLADVWATCPVCSGRRFNHETLQVKYRGKSIDETLNLEVGQALEHFEHVPKIRAMLQTLHDVGLDYVKLGQSSPTLSGGEAQRVKLAKELCRKSTGKTLYILDEPTTGLHFEDVRKLLEVLHGFVDQGNTVLVIEHNLDVIKTADWVIDMGPEGGSGGGEVVVQGTPEQVAKCKKSHTGVALVPVLAGKLPVVAEKKKRTATKPITSIDVVGARQHNLKNIDATIPRDAMTVFCGPSGSGKSSLAMDTLCAEGRRRYVESLSSYARQFLGQIAKPKVETIVGLSPAIAVEQKTTGNSPRSTVGTITEIHDYLRVLYARVGERYCPSCQIAMGAQTVDTIIEKILTSPDGAKIYILAPLERKGQPIDTIREEIRRAGYARLRIDGKSYPLDDMPDIDHKRKHTIEVVIDRNVVRAGTRTRIAEAIEQALAFGKGVVHIAHVDADKDEKEWKVERFSQHLACSSCGKSYEELSPHHYSFNSPLGWCPTCEGLGFRRGAKLELLLRDTSLSLREGAISAWPDLEPSSPFLPFAEALARHVGFSLDTPYQELEPAHQKAILHGVDAWIPLQSPPAKSKGKKVESAASHKFQYKGLFPAIDEATRVSFQYRMRLEHLVDEVACSSCAGARLRRDAAATRFSGKTMGELCALPTGDALQLFQKLAPTPRAREVCGEVLREVINRLKFLVEVGLDYISLDRPGPTLSGGESQRIRLASQIGSGLTGVLYVLDEPTIGLHPRDNSRLLAALHRLRDLGNTMILVEHDREVIASADYVLDFGPGAGTHGGEVTATGSPALVKKAKTSLTGDYLAGRKAIPVPTNRRILSRKPLADAPRVEDFQKSHEFPGKFLSVIGARQHSLKGIDVHFPLSAFISVTGVSGSGKSSLVNEVLFNTLARKLHRAQTPGAAHEEILGIESIDKIINVDQAPLGNAPSSNPATYTGLFDLVRELFARLPESKVRGYAPRRFSFNQKGGRCEACEGNGSKKIEMHFLPDVWVECDSCAGSRYNPETLLVRYRGKSIADVLNMSVAEALELFGNIPKIRAILQTLADVGLEYMALGQSAPTMSGGEAQRVKLAAELARPSTGRTLYLLDEPTTGLHFDDVRKLLVVLHRLVDLGNTVIVVEHNLDVIKTSDWVIDMGPEAGAGGGSVVAQGTPEEVALAAKAKPLRSQTARYLAEVLQAGPHAERELFDPKKALQVQEGDVDLIDVGKEAKLPWEVDGRRWHTQDRVTSRGTACRWDGKALAQIIDSLETHDCFSPTNWNHRSVVEITGLVKSNGWFLHAFTGHESCLTLAFRVASNSFKQPELTAQLGLKPTTEIAGLESHTKDKRVECSTLPGAIQEVTVRIVDLNEVQTPAFGKFLESVVKAFQKRLAKSSDGIEDQMPWKKNGEAWHLGDKGFPPGKGRKWDGALLPKLLGIVREVLPQVEIKWDGRDAILLKVPGIGKSWSRWKTKESAAIECQFYGKAGSINLSRVESIGRDRSLERQRADGTETLTLHFTRVGELPAKELKTLLIDHLAGFREKAAHGEEG